MGVLGAVLHIYVTFPMLNVLFQVYFGLQRKKYWSDKDMMIDNFVPKNTRNNLVVVLEQCVAFGLPFSIQK